MKIVFFMEAYYCGGVDTFAINLINNWPQKTDDLILICNRRHTGLEFIRKSVLRPCKIIKHDMAIFTGFFELTQEDSVFEKSLNLLLKLFSPILRYVFLIYNTWYLKRILLPLNADRLMIINGAYPGGDSCRAAAICWGLFSKKPLSVHNFHGVVLKPKLHIRLQEALVDELVSKFTKVFVTVSEATAKTISCRPNIYRRNKILFIYNGIEERGNIPDSGLTKDIKQEIGIPQPSRLCLMLGAYHCHKNFDKGHYFLLSAFKKAIEHMPEAHLLICGFGYEKDLARVKALILSLGIENNVHLSGFRNDIPSLLREADMLLISSQVFESFCLAGIEAMANAVPVVATKVGAIPEIIINNEGGYCVEKNDIDSYTNMIIKLLKNEDLRKEQGQRGYRRYKELFTATRMAKEYEKLIKNG
ncbi:MAG: glycosyltransferase family 4 protein [Candidatus Omnitrophica bacterium]|nr:glycosyltransferase family 4 protein [Candidatus Omnitrophota bacterium]